MKIHSNSHSNWFVLPALVYLAITIMSGIWIRLQWVVPDWAFFNTKFAIHAHSHLAMLGWLFPILFRFLLPKSAGLSLYKKITLALLHSTIIAMFPAFLLEGYAFWSILLSSLFLIFSYILVYQYRAELALGVNFLNTTAIGLYVLSTVGPWALGGAEKFGTEWLQAWISFFLHLQFNGWITVSILAILFKNKPLSTYEKLGFGFMVTGTILVLPGYMYSTLSAFWIGFLYASSLTLLMGTLFLFISMYKSNSILSVKMIFIGIFVIKTLAISLVSFEFAQSWIHDNHTFRVAFTHFSLLSWASSFLLFALFGIHRYVLVFFSAALMKGVILGLEAFQWIHVFGFPFSVQWFYIGLGLIMVISLISIMWWHFVANVTVFSTAEPVSLP